jgi:hypothetical protein
MTWEHQDDAHDALVKLPDGSNLSIMFSSDYDGNGEEEWVVEFWRNNSQEVTGEGDAYRIFATVMEAIKQFVQAEEPDKIRFSATKDTESGDRNLSRSNLYNTMVRRYASALGYNAEISDHAGSTVYELYLMG